MLLALEDRRVLSSFAERNANKLLHNTFVHLKIEEKIADLIFFNDTDKQMISYKRPTSSTRDGIEQLGSSFGSIFLLFHECSWDHAHSRLEQSPAFGP